jgi:hypothetical protein
MLKGFFFIVPDFKYLGPATMKALEKRVPDASFSAVVLGKLELAYVKTECEASMRQLFHLDELERKWLSTPYDDSRVVEYEKRLGPGALRRILVADRFVGRGFVTGGIVAPTPLMRLCRDFSSQRRYVMGAVDFLFAQLEKERPDFLFFPSVADAFSAAAECVCQNLGIPFLSIWSTRIGKYSVIDELQGGICRLVQRDFELALADPTVVEDTLPLARRFIEEFRSRPFQPDYLVFTQSRAFRRLPWIDIAALAFRTITRRESESLQHPMPATRLAFEFTRYAREWLVRKSRMFGKLGDLEGRPFAYYPLHYDPECSTMVWSPMYTNQVAVVEALAKSLPLNMVLAVKEHASMLGKRPRGFYKRLARLPGVVLISPFEDTFALIKKSALTCVITGTAAWEALLLQRPSICLGPAPSVAVGEGYVHCPDLTALPWAIDRALSTPPADDNRLGIYVASLLKHGFEFPAEVFWGGLTPEKLDEHRPIVDEMCTIILVWLRTMLWDSGETDSEFREELANGRRRR